MLNLVSMWRSTRVLDGRKVGSADRSQSVVHALLSAKSQVPFETPSPYLRGKIAQRLEETRPFTPGAGDAWMASGVRGGVLAAVLLAMSGIVIWTTNGFGGKAEAPAAPLVQAIDHDDPDPDVMAAPQSGPSLAINRADPLVEPRRERSVASVQPTPEQLQAKRDFEQLATTLMQALPVRQDDPR